jgi:hypothetical protein
MTLEMKIRKTVGAGMDTNKSFYCGNALKDQVRGSGWFVGQFVPPDLGLRHQTDVEIKWGIHPDGEKRSQGWATGHGTTVSVLIRGHLRVTLYTGDPPQMVALRSEGDYIIFAPDTVHSWEAVGDTVVLSVRFPSVETWQRASLAEQASDG